MGKLIVRALDKAAAFFDGRVTWESSTCRSGTGESFTPCVLRSIAVFQQPSRPEKVMSSTTARGYLSQGGGWMSWNERMSENARE